MRALVAILLVFVGIRSNGVSELRRPRVSVLVQKPVKVRESQRNGVKRWVNNEFSTLLSQASLRLLRDRMLEATIPPLCVNIVVMLAYQI